MDWNKRNRFLGEELRNCVIGWALNIALFSIVIIFRPALFSALSWFALYFAANCVSIFLVAYFPNLFKWVKTLRGRFVRPEIGTAVILLSSVMVFILGVILSPILFHNIVISTSMIFVFAVFHYGILITLRNKVRSKNRSLMMIPTIMPSKVLAKRYKN